MIGAAFRLAAFAIRRRANVMPANTAGSSAKTHQAENLPLRRVSGAAETTGREFGSSACSRIGATEVVRFAARGVG
jgi:hypothetical protein